MRHLCNFYWQTFIASICLVAMSWQVQAADWQQILHDSDFDQLLNESQIIDNPDEIALVADFLWQKYRDLVRQDETRVNAIDRLQLQDGDKTMRISLSKVGEKPEQGYPLYIALHGGGGAPASLNDSQWEHMKRFYLPSVENGIYVAPRGVTNTWNLHFVDESYRLYDQLIENLIALEDVDPNRVYIIGFSAGGDGVFQIAPRMADRWAAANMSAGHYNWVRFDNLYQTPFLIQMGQLDSAYRRNTVAVENYIELQRLQGLRGGYQHDLFLHYRGSHNSWRDNDASGRQYEIFSDPIGWLQDQRVQTTYRNTNAIHWMDQYTREPYPSKLYWDPRTNAPRNVNQGAAYLANGGQGLSQPRDLFYWLDLGPNAELTEDFVMEASYDTTGNTIYLSGLDQIQSLRVLIHQDMLDLNQQVSIVVDEKVIGSFKPEPDLQTMTRTLLERGDPNFIFPSEVVIAKDSAEWKIIK